MGEELLHKDYESYYRYHLFVCHSVHVSARDKKAGDTGEAVSANFPAVLIFCVCE